MSVIGVAAIALSAAVVASVALPVVADRWSDSDNDAKRLIAATATAVGKADDLGESLGHVVPAPVEASEEGDRGGITQSGAGGSGAGRQPRGPEYDADHEVAMALQALADLGAGQTGFTADQRIIAVQNLQEAWSPRYGQAEEDHRRLLYRIEHADRAARRYFEAQSNLTRQINNSEARLRAEGDDAQERELYRQWREQAGRTMAQADRIMADLEDMDIKIAKQLLSASFASVYRDFQQMPAAISALHHDLEQFQARSEEISVAFGGY